MKRFILLVMLLALCVERTPGGWFDLVIELDINDEFFDKTDRRFVQHMINVLSAHEDAVPTPAQEKWLLDMKRRLDQRRK